MSAPTPSICRMVVYVLSEQDAAAVNKRRADASRLNAAGVTLASQELGPQIHVGNQVAAGDTCPAVITRVWDADSGGCNLKVLLDGNDDLWVTSRLLDNPDTDAERISPDPDHEGPGYQPGTWHWPPRV